MIFAPANRFAASAFVRFVGLVANADQARVKKRLPFVRLRDLDSLFSIREEIVIGTGVRERVQHRLMMTLWRSVRRRFVSTPANTEDCACQKVTVAFA